MFIFRKKVIFCRPKGGEFFSVGFRRAYDIVCVGVKEDWHLEQNLISTHGKHKELYVPRESQY